MSLRERLVQVGEVRKDDIDASHSGRDEVERRLHYILIDELHDELDVEDGDRVQTRRHIERRLSTLLANETIPLSTADKAEVTAAVIDNILGYGPIEPLLRDPGVTEIMVNRPDRIYIERSGRIFRTERRFVDDGTFDASSTRSSVRWDVASMSHRRWSTHDSLTVPV